VFNMRGHREGPFINTITTNRLVWAAVLLCVGLVAGPIYQNDLAEVLGLTRLTPPALAVALGVSLMPLAISQIWRAAFGRAFRTAIP